MHVMKRLRAALPLVLVMAAAPARATVVVALGVDDLVHQSDVVILGVVERAESAWEGGVIVTRATVRVERTLKGAPAQAIVVRRMGGVVGTVGQIVYGEAALAAGERTLLFLERRRGGLGVTGMAQGEFVVTTDPATGETRARQALGGLALARQGSRGLRIFAPRPRSVPLVDLLVEVERLARTEP